MLLFSLSSSSQKILILGDSHAYGLEYSIESAMKLNNQWEITLKGVSSSGLARDDFFNWIDWSDQLNEQYDYVFILLGTNDGQNMSGKSSLIFGSKEWELLYSARIEQLLMKLKQNKKIFWVTIPPVESKDLLRKTEYIQLVINEVCRFHGINILDSKINLSIGKKDFLQSDGIHLTRKGSDILFYSMMGEINKLANNQLP
jgi:hypothetical protein